MWQALEKENHQHTEILFLSPSSCSVCFPTVNAPGLPQPFTFPTSPLLDFSSMMPAPSTRLPSFLLSWSYHFSSVTHPCHLPASQTCGLSSSSCRPAGKSQGLPHSLSFPTSHPIIPWPQAPRTLNIIPPVIKYCFLILQPRMPDRNLKFFHSQGYLYLNKS